MNTSKRITLETLIFAIFISVILAVSIHGLNGNPGVEELNTISWKQNGPFELSPERGRYALTYSITRDKSLYFSTPLARFVVPDLGYSNSHYVSLFAPTISILVIPGFIVGSLIGLEQVGAFSVIAIFALANAMVIRHMAIRMGTGHLSALVGAIIFLFATPSFSYSVTLYQHQVSTFIILISLYLIMWKNSFISEVFIWFLIALAFTIDYPNIIMMLPIMFVLIKRIFTISERNKWYSISVNIRKLIAVLGISVPIGLFMIFNTISYGNPLRLSGTVMTVKSINEDGTPLQSENSKLDENVRVPIENQDSQSAVGFFKTRNILNGLYTHFLSTDRGILFYTPIMFTAIGGSILLFKKRDPHLPILITIIGLNIITYSMWGDPWGGWAFGSRYLIPTYALGSILITYLLPYIKNNAMLFILIILLFGYSSYVNTAGALTSNTNPPRVEILNLEQQTGRPQKQTYERNIELLNNNISKSFAYQHVLHKIIPAKGFFLIVWSSIFVVGTIPLFILYAPRKVLYVATKQ